jgi:hypothetical protein
MSEEKILLNDEKVEEKEALSAEQLEQVSGGAVYKEEQVKIG